MSNDILKLKPEGIWKEFNGILGVPRPSKKETKSNGQKTIKSSISRKSAVTSS